MATSKNGSHVAATEPDRVSTKIVGGFGIVLVALSIAAAILIALLFRGFQKVAEKQDAETVAAEGMDRPLAKLPPPPRLEIEGGRHQRDFRTAEEERLETYGWMDRSLGAVHVPIERAIDLIAERGVAPLPPGPAPVAPVANPTPPASGARK
jgi:hypothetical protein